MISIVAKFKVKEGQEEKFVELAKGLIAPSQAEEGCLEYNLHKDLQHELTYTMIEKWKDQQAIDLHNKTVHFTSTVPKIVKIADVEIDLYQPVN
ncbi:putative quinol monooxygenase [uncultured Draconibacterium sp.]|uniref:putative quinol monooxygenase n=1 Tax=uncultured Draconibacterium sp. TaxID=1573823 RepID=UPI0025D11E66|nr:putative quinol monooxygenase [uncultured Draconibacterium sp.]